MLKKNIEFKNCLLDNLRIYANFWLILDERFCAPMAFWRKAPFFIFLIFACLAPSAYGQVAVGLFAGLDQSKFSGDTPRDFAYAFKDGYALGLTFDFGVGEKMFISVRPNFTENGADVSRPEEDDFSIVPLPEDPDTVYLYPVVNRYIAVPVIYQIYVSRAFYGNAGLELAYNLTSDVNIDGEIIDLRAEMTDFLVSASFGWGVSIPIGRTSLNLELSYAQSLNTMTVQDPDEAENPPRLRTRRFRLAAYFTIFATKKTL